MNDDDDILEIYSASDVTEAYFLRDLLVEQGIEARVVGDALLTGTGVLPVGEATSPKLWVHRRDEQRAQQVLLEYERKHRAPHPDRVSVTGWRCGQCGEQVEADFDVCWNCQTPRPGSEAP